MPEEFEKLIDNIDFQKDRQLICIIGKAGCGIKILK